MRLKDLIGDVERGFVGAGEGREGRKGMGGGVRVGMLVDCEVCDVSYLFYNVFISR